MKTAAASKSMPAFFGGVQRVHIGFDDPSQATGSPDQVLAEFRRVRDEIRAKITAYLQEQ